MSQQMRSLQRARRSMPHTFNGERLGLSNKKSGDDNGRAQRSAVLEEAHCVRLRSLGGNCMVLVTGRQVLLHEPADQANQPTNLRTRAFQQYASKIDMSVEGLLPNCTLLCQCQYHRLYSRYRSFFPLTSVVATHQWQGSWHNA